MYYYELLHNPEKCNGIYRKYLTQLYDLFGDNVIHKGTTVERNVMEHFTHLQQFMTLVTWIWLTRYETVKIDAVVDAPLNLAISVCMDNFYRGDLEMGTYGMAAIAHITMVLSLQHANL